MSDYENERPRRVLLIDDSLGFLESFRKSIAPYAYIELTTFSEFEKSLLHIHQTDLLKYDLAIVDLCLADHMYDQGGLTILDEIKRKSPDLPVVVITGRSHHFPGLAQTIAKYPAVELLSKRNIGSDPLEFLRCLFEREDSSLTESEIHNSMNSRRGPILDVDSPRQDETPWKIITKGFGAVVFVIATAVAAMLAFERFSEFSTFVNSVLTILLVVFLSVIIRLFGRHTVSRAVSALSKLTKST